MGKELITGQTETNTRAISIIQIGTVKVFILVLTEIRFEGVFEMGEISGEGTYFWNDGNSVKLNEKKSCRNRNLIVLLN